MGVFTSFNCTSHAKSRKITHFLGIGKSKSDGAPFLRNIHINKLSIFGAQMEHFLNFTRNQLIRFF